MCCHRLNCCRFPDLFISYVVSQTNALYRTQHSHFSLIHQSIIPFRCCPAFSTVCHSRFYDSLLDFMVVMCEMKIPVEMQDKVFKTAIRPAMAYGSECWVIKKKDESKLNSAEMRMLRWARGKTRLDHIRNVDIRKWAEVKPVETFLENNRLKWFGHCLMRERNHICAKSLRLEASGRRSKGRRQNRWNDNIKGDMKKYQLTEDLAQDRKYGLLK